MLKMKQQSKDLVREQIWIRIEGKEILLLKSHTKFLLILILKVRLIFHFFLFAFLDSFG